MRARWACRWRACSGARAARAPQAGLTPGERRRNVRGAFAIAPWVSRAARRGRIEDRVLVLVDDVMTTAATLDACARVLKQAGAREVRTLTLARALPHAAAGRVSAP